MKRSLFFMICILTVPVLHGMKRKTSSSSQEQKTPKINSKIYSVIKPLPVGQANLQLDYAVIVEDWFLKTVNADHIRVLNKIAQSMGTSQPATITGKDFDIFMQFPTAIGNKLRNYMHIPELDEYSTEVDESDEE